MQHNAMQTSTHQLHIQICGFVNGQVRLVCKTTNAYPCCVCECFVCALIQGAPKQRQIQRAPPQAMNNNSSNQNGLEDDEASIDEDENSDGGEVSMAGSDHGRGQRDGGNMMGGQYAGGRDDGDDLGVSHSWCCIVSHSWC